MKVSVKDITGKDAGEHEVKFAVIENAIGTQAVHDYVTAYRAGLSSAPIRPSAWVRLPAAARSPGAEGHRPRPCRFLRLPTLAWRWCDPRSPAARL